LSVVLLAFVVLWLLWLGCGDLARGLVVGGNMANRQVVYLTRRGGGGECLSGRPGR
jgi:hypothetical protein